MNRCDFCHVDINDNLTACPLCFKSLNQNSLNPVSEYPEYKKLDNSVLNFALKTVLFVFLSISIISLIVNMFVWQGIPWFLLVFSSLFYIWILLKNTIFGRAGFGIKVIIQLLGLSLLLIVIDLVNFELSWSVNYMIPIAIIIANFTITFRILIKRIKWRDYSVYLVILLCTGFIPMLLFAFNVITVLWPSVSAILYSLLTFLAFFIFSFKRFGRELLKIFHLQII